MQYSPKSLAALTDAVLLLARSDGALPDRLRCAERSLAEVPPSNLDAEQWADLVRVRGIIRRSSGTLLSQQASDILINLLVRYAANGSQQPAGPLTPLGR